MTTATEAPTAGTSAEFVDWFQAGWAIGARDPEGFFSHIGSRLTPDALMTQPLAAPLHGDAGMRRLFTPLFEAIPDLHGDVVRWGETADGVMVELRLQRQRLRRRPVSWITIDRIVLRDGKSPSAPRTSTRCRSPGRWPAHRAPRASCCRRCCGAAATDWRPMTRCGDVYENKVTGEYCVVLRGSEDRGEGPAIVHLLARPGAAVAGEHFHPALTERFRVVSGTLSAKVDGRELTLGPGEDATVEPGVKHDWWNASSTEDAHVVVEISGQGLEHFELMIANLFSLANDGKLDSKGARDRCRARCSRRSSPTSCASRSRPRRSSAW